MMWRWMRRNRDTFPVLQILDLTIKIQILICTLRSSPRSIVKAWMRVNIEEIKNVCVISYLLLAYAINPNGWCKYRVVTAYIGENNARFFFCACTVDSSKRERKKNGRNIDVRCTVYCAPLHSRFIVIIRMRACFTMRLAFLSFGAEYRIVTLELTLRCLRRKYSFHIREQRRGFCTAGEIINHLSLHVAPRLPLYSFRILATFILDLFHGFYPTPPVSPVLSTGPPMFERPFKQAFTFETLEIPLTRIT